MLEITTFEPNTYKQVTNKKGALLEHLIISEVMIFNLY